MSINLPGLVLSSLRKAVRPLYICLLICVARLAVVLNSVGTCRVTTLSTGRQLLVTILSWCRVRVILLIGLDIRTYLIPVRGVVSTPENLLSVKASIFRLLVKCVPLVNGLRVQLKNILLVTRVTFCLWYTAMTCLCLVGPIQDLAGPPGPTSINV